MIIQASCDILLETVDPTPMILMLRPRSGAAQWIRRDEFRFSENVPVVQHSDAFGNLAQRLTIPSGEFSIRTVVEAQTSDQVDHDLNAGFVDIEALPESLLNYLLPTRYCESDRFSPTTWNIVGDTLLGYPQVQAITDWIRRNIEYQPTTGEILLSAEEVRQQGFGVCRDLAHLGIAMCRSISIPARMVVGYLHGLEPMTLHAWFEAYLGNRWFTFDPSQPTLTGGRIVIAYGRDSADVPVYHLFGHLPLRSEMTVTVTELNG